MRNFVAPPDEECGVRKLSAIKVFRLDKCWDPREPVGQEAMVLRV
jgi:hypothetical protein